MEISFRKFFFATKNVAKRSTIETLNKIKMRRSLIKVACITATLTVLAGVMLIACKKENGTSSTAEMQITNNNAVQKAPLWNEFEVKTPNGTTIYNRDNAPFWPFDFCPIDYCVYIYDKFGNKIGEKWYRWPCAGNITEIPPPTGANGLFIEHQQVIDIMNTTATERHHLVTAIVNEQDERLSRIIGMDLLEEVMQGNYIISSVEETAYGTATGENYYYIITFFSNDVNDVVEELTVYFSYNTK